MITTGLFKSRNFVKFTISNFFLRDVKKKCKKKINVVSILISLRLIYRRNYYVSRIIIPVARKILGLRLILKIQTTRNNYKILLKIKSELKNFFNALNYNSIRIVIRWKWCTVFQKIYHEYLPKIRRFSSSTILRLHSAYR